MPQPLCMWMVTERGARTTQTDGYPSYHLASVVDDAHMRISHGFPLFSFLFVLFSSFCIPLAGWAFRLGFLPVVCCIRG
jgi:hypothetical protein